MSFILDDVKILYVLVCVYVYEDTVVNIIIYFPMRYNVFTKHACPEGCLAMTQSLILAPSLEQNPGGLGPSRFMWILWDKARHTRSKESPVSDGPKGPRTMQVYFYVMGKDLQGDHN